jgi:stage II sporulation protein D
LFFFAKRACAVLLVFSAASSHAVETVRIAMGSFNRQVELRGNALSFGPDSEEASFSVAPQNDVSIRLNDGKLEINGDEISGRVIRFRAGTPVVDIGVLGREPLTAGGIAVLGDVVVRIDGSQLQLINVIALEDYLAAVLGSEMSVDFPIEALKAQAVASRTYALHRKIEMLDKPYHLASSVLSQVYKGIHREAAKTREAVVATQGEVLTFDLAPVEAYFHASCGGHTEAGREALGRDLPYLQSVDCPCGDLALSARLIWHGH